MPRSSTLRFYFALFFIALAAALTLAYVTPAGIGLTNDSAAYIGGARSILAGTGYSDIWLDSSLEAITHYPPLLSLTLSSIGLLGLDPLRGARLLNIFLLGANTFLMGLLGSRLALPSEGRMTSRTWLTGIFLALLFGLDAALLRVHAYALSEPLFLFFSLAAFITFDLASAQRAAHNKLTPGYWLLITGFLTSLAFLTRYSGLALIATFFISLFILNSTWRARLTQTALFLLGAVPPIAAWFIRNRLVAGNATNRTFQYHPLGWKTIEIGLYNISQVLMPIEPWRQGLMKSGALLWILPALALLLFAWLLLQTWRLLLRADPGTQAPKPLPFTNALYIFGYLGAVLFSMSFFDASTKFQPRILSPLYVSGLILFVFALYRLARVGEKPFKNFALLAICVVGLAALGLSALDYRLTAAELRDSAGLGYGSWKWHDSLVMADLKELPAEVAIYTNTPPAVYLVTGRASRVIPTTIDPVDNLPRGDYEQNLAQMRADLLAGRAVLALFDTSGIEDALGVENLEAFSSGLTVLKKAQGDILYGKP
jgi:4-amino-4-deoxy-L-arabinose transferase-like glycosyltransferase